VAIARRKRGWQHGWQAVAMTKATIAMPMVHDADESDARRREHASTRATGESGADQATKSNRSVSEASARH